MLQSNLVHNIRTEYTFNFNLGIFHSLSKYYCINKKKISNIYLSYCFTNKTCVTYNIIMSTFSNLQILSTQEFRRASKPVTVFMFPIVNDLK